MAIDRSGGVLEAQWAARIGAVGTLARGRVTASLRDRDAQFRRGAGCGELAGVEVAGLRPAMQAGDEGGDRETLGRAEAAGIASARTARDSSPAPACAPRGRLSRIASSAEPGVMPASVSMTSVASCDLPRRRAPFAGLARRTQPSAGATFSATSSIDRRIRMRRIDRMDLHGEIGGARERAVGSQRGDHLVRRADMDVHRGDQVAHQVARRQVAGRGQPMAHAATGRFRRSRSASLRSSATNTVREARMRGARPLRQRLEIGVDHRVLDVGQRGVAASSAGRGWVRDSISPSPAAPARARAVARRRSPARCDRPGRGSADRACRRRAARRPTSACVSSARLRSIRPWRSLLSRPKAVNAVRLPPGPDADFQAAAAHQVEHRGILGDADRQLQRQRDDAGAEADARGPRRGLRQEHEGRRQAAFVFVEMVLGDPGRVEAAALGMGDLRGGQPIALGGVGLVEQAGEEAQALEVRRVSSSGPTSHGSRGRCKDRRHAGREWRRSARGCSRCRVARTPARPRRHRPGGPCA